MLDIDQGTYPFVTSSNADCWWNLTIGSGVGPSKIIEWLICLQGIYEPLSVMDLAELFDKVGDRIHEWKPHEYSTTTEAVRVGWLTPL